MEEDEREDLPWRGRPVVLCRLLEAEAALMAGRLRAEGIPASVDPVDQRWFGAYRGGPSVNEVVVPEDRLAEAREFADRILRMLGSGDGTPRRRRPKWIRRAGTGRTPGRRVRGGPPPGPRPSPPTPGS